MPHSWSYTNKAAKKNMMHSAKCGMAFRDMPTVVGSGWDQPPTTQIK